MRVLTGTSLLQKEAAAEIPTVEGEGSWTGRRLLSATWTKTQTPGRGKPLEQSESNLTQRTQCKKSQTHNGIFAVIQDGKRASENPRSGPGGNVLRGAGPLLATESPGEGWASVPPGAATKTGDWWSQL